MSQYHGKLCEKLKMNYDCPYSKLYLFLIFFGEFINYLLFILFQIFPCVFINHFELDFDQFSKSFDFINLS